MVINQMVNGRGCESACAGHSTLEHSALRCVSDL